MERIYEFEQKAQAKSTKVGSKILPQIKTTVTAVRITTIHLNLNSLSIMYWRVNNLYSNIFYFCLLQKHADSSQQGGGCLNFFTFHALLGIVLVTVVRFARK